MGFPASDFDECGPVVWGHGEQAEKVVEQLFQSVSPPSLWQPEWLPAREAVVQAMAKIIRNVEASRLLKVNENPPSRDSDRFLTDTVCYQASKMADAVNASAIVTMTYSGYTAERISAHRPASSIFVFTSNRQILNKLNLYWGVRCFYYDGMVSTDQTFTDVLHVLRDKDYVQRDETVITVASMPIAARGTTNMLKVSVVE